MENFVRETGPVSQCVNTLRARHNGRHFADDIFKCIFLSKNVWIPIEISLKFVLKGPINYIPASVQIMAWRQSEPMLVRLLTHICVTRPQCVKPALRWWREPVWLHANNKTLTTASVRVPVKSHWQVTRRIVSLPGQQFISQPVGLLLKSL